MSGPIAATFGLDAGLAIAAAEVIRAALAVAEGYGAEAGRRAETAGQRAAESRQRREAGLAARQALAEEVGRAEARLRRLAAARDQLAGSAGEGLPARPPAEDRLALAAYLETLGRRVEALSAELAALAAAAPQRLPPQELAALQAAAPSLDQQLAAFVARERLAGRLGDALLAERRALVERVLARAVLAEGQALPEDLETLAAELMAAATAERAEALASELRLRVARHNESATAQAAALVLEQSLRDLGYEVDGIGETLFVEGGVAHFQKDGWGDYQVRLRVDAARGSLNFNVVRPGVAGEDRRREDMMAEERWCAEFPQLQQTLAARGIRVAVTRMLGAGEVPVQVVPAASLPRRAAEEEQRRTDAPKALHRK